MKKRSLPDLSPRFGLIFSLVVLVLVAVLNTWAYLDRVANNTISAWVTYDGEVPAAVPFALGAVVGHWCSRSLHLPEPFLGFPVLVGMVALLLLGDWLTSGALARYPFILWFLFGITPGSMLWPMSKVAT